MSNEPSEQSSFWQRMGRASVRSLRIILILAVIAGFIAAIYYGTPYIYNKVIAPIENNTLRLSEVENKQSSEYKQLSAQVSELKSRLADLETRQTENAQDKAEMQGQITALETAVSTHTETLAQLKIMQISLDKLSAASDEYQSLLVGKNSALADLQHQVTINRAIELLSRARLYLSQSNFGLAKQDVQAAKNLLIGLQSSIPTENNPAMQSVISRLDLALVNLPEFPVVAVGDVDIAWQLLINGLPEQPQDAATPEPTQTMVPPEPVPTATP